MLYGEVIPPTGGDPLFADQHAARGGHEGHRRLLLLLLTLAERQAGLVPL